MGTVVFAIALIAAVYLVSSILLGGVAVVVATVLVAAILGWAWFCVPLVTFNDGTGIAPPAEPQQRHLSLGGPVATWRHPFLPRDRELGRTCTEDAAVCSSESVRRRPWPRSPWPWSIGLGITLVVLVRGSLAEARDSRRSVEITRISDSSIALLAALQRERGSASSTSPAVIPATRPTTRPPFLHTDEVAGEFSETWLESGGALRQEEQGALSGVAATLAPLGEVRSAVTDAEAEAPSTSTRSSWSPFTRPSPMSHCSPRMRKTSG